MTSGGKSALIFGASGFVGGYLARELKAHGYEVFGSDRGESSLDPSLDAYRGCDVTDAAGVAKVVEELEPSVIVNLAAVSSVGQSWRMPQATVSVNVNGALNILEAAKAMDHPPKVLLVGSSEEYAPSTEPFKETDPLDSSSPYGISKIAQERFARLYAEQYGLNVCLTRSFNHTGPGQSAAFVLPSWCKQAAEIEASGRPGKMTVGNLEVFRDFSDVRDVVRAYGLVLEKGLAGEVYNVGSGNAVSLRQCLDEVRGFSSQPIEVEVDQALVRPTDTKFICCDAAKIREELGWAPEHCLKDTLREVFVGFVEQERVSGQILG